MDKESKKLFVKFISEDIAIKKDFDLRRVKFSTVFDFNDFNEFNYKIPYNCNINFNRFLNKFYIFYKSCKYDPLQIEKLECDLYTEEAIKNTLNILESFSENKFSSEIKQYMSILLEFMLYSSVGICCFSDIDIFKSDAAQIMFAHYASKLKGLALIYEAYDNDIKYVKYDKKDIVYTFDENDYFNLIDDDYSYKNVKKFLKKSKGWSYENEYRIFSSPGLKEIRDFNIELKAVLYTPWVNKEFIKNLQNSKIYKKIFFEKIYPGHDVARFKIYKKKFIDICQWLEEELKSKFLL